MDLQRPDPLIITRKRFCRNDPNTPSIPAKRSVRAEQYDADLQRAIALSLAEGSTNRDSNNIVGSHPGMIGRKLEGTDAIENEDDELRLAIEASLADMHQVRPSAPGAMEDQEVDYKVSVARYHDLLGRLVSLIASSCQPLPTYDLTSRETETMLTFAQTVEHAVGFGDQNFQRFPHVYPLYEQAHGLAGKLQRNIEEKATKQCEQGGPSYMVPASESDYRILIDMLSEMHDRLMYAVRRYDQLQEEQEAYNQRQRHRPPAAQYQHEAYRTMSPSRPEYATYPSVPQEQPFRLPISPPTMEGRQQPPPMQAFHTPIYHSAYSTLHGYAPAVSEVSNAQPLLRPISEMSASERRPEDPYSYPAQPSYVPSSPPHTTQPVRPGQPEYSTLNHSSQAFSSMGLAESYNRNEEVRVRTLQDLPALPDAPSHALPQIDQEPAPKKEMAEEPLLIEL